MRKERLALRAQHLLGAQAGTGRHRETLSFVHVLRQTECDGRAESAGIAIGLRDCLPATAAEHLSKVTFDTFRHPMSSCMYMCMYGSRAAMGLATGTATCCAQFMHAHMDCSPVLRCAMRRWLLAKAPTAGLS